jgi:hypothetical protein
MTNDEDHGSVRAGHNDWSTLNLGMFYFCLTKKVYKKNISVGKGTPKSKIPKFYTIYAK